VKRFKFTVLLCTLAACAAPPEEAPAYSQEVHSLAGLYADDLKGQAHELELLREQRKPIALVFWQTWCAGCIKEAPEMARAAREHEGIQFLGIVSGPDGTVDEDEVLAIKERFGLPYPQLRDRELLITDYFDVKGTPTIIVIDAGGHVVFRGHEAPASWGSFTE
jgi:thiol-disulfide isomerase/thioredoxin